MPTQSLTNEALITALRKSLLSAKDKRAIMPYIPRMNDEDKKRLLELIDKAKVLDTDIKNKVRDQNAKLVALARKNESEMSRVVSEAIKVATKQMEQISKAGETEGMKSLVEEINKI